MEDKREVAALVSGITPHSFRAGLASDLEWENIPRSRIKKVGRWNSDRAMEQYIRDGLAQRLRSIQYRSIYMTGKRIRVGKCIAPRAQWKRDTDSSEGYDQDDSGS